VNKLGGGFSPAMNFLTLNSLAAPDELEHCDDGEDTCWAEGQAFLHKQLHINPPVLLCNKPS
jgi:hypothetical protein